MSACFHQYVIATAHKKLTSLLRMEPSGTAISVAKLSWRSTTLIFTSTTDTLIRWKWVCWVCYGLILFFCFLCSSPGLPIFPDSRGCTHPCFGILKGIFTLFKTSYRFWKPIFLQNHTHTHTHTHTPQIWLSLSKISQPDWLSHALKKLPCEHRDLLFVVQHSDFFFFFFSSSSSSCSLTFFLGRGSGPDWHENLNCKSDIFKHVTCNRKPRSDRNSWMGHSRSSWKLPPLNAFLCLAPLLLQARSSNIAYSTTCFALHCVLWWFSSPARQIFKWHFHSLLRILKGKSHGGGGGCTDVHELDSSDC